MRSVRDSNVRNANASIARPAITTAKFNTYVRNAELRYLPRVGNKHRERTKKQHHKNERKTQGIELRTAKFFMALVQFFYFYFIFFFRFVCGVVFLGLNFFLWMVWLEMFFVFSVWERESREWNCKFRRGVLSNMNDTLWRITGIFDVWSFLFMKMTNWKIRSKDMSKFIIYSFF